MSFATLVKLAVNMAVNMGVIWASYWAQGRDVIDCGKLHAPGSSHEHMYDTRNLQYEQKLTRQIFISNNIN